MPPISRTLSLAALVAASVAGRTLAAQLPLGERVACAGQIVSEIVIRTQPPALGDLSKRGRVANHAAKLVKSLHATTNAEVVKRLVIQHEGAPCRELARAESERILRAQPFIAEATITPRANADGTVTLEIVTVDELEWLVDVGVKAATPYVGRVRLGNTNIAGEALAAQAGWSKAVGPYRDSWGARVDDYQFLGRPYQMTLSGTRRPLGGDWTILAAHAFQTDLQRVAWRAATGAREEYIALLRENAAPPSMNVLRSFTDIGGIVRIGEPGRLSLFGASYTREYDAGDNRFVRVTRNGLFPDSTVVTARDSIRPYRSARANLLWGVRNIHFVRTTGFDALTAAQDLRLGFQLGVLAGRSLAVLGSQNDDIFVSADMYGGLGNEETLAAFQVQGEGRQDYNTNRWDGILGSGRAAVYRRMRPHHTLLLDGEWSGGWHQRLPFQLTLGDDQGGVRGYGASDAAGARRVVARAEDRWYLGRLKALADFGVAPFVDAGRLWAGDAIFGADTKVKIGAGVSLLVAVPPRSKRLFRVDVGYPLSPDAHAKLDLRIVVSDFTRNFWDEPRDVRRSRESTVPTSIFNWP
ncbi:MAG: hypothetical protein HOQ09_14040 [Gemmatimonadaceae bacterium]|nr:hypothetical protein [Gemmatimonadaceae bacterium]